jgi:hypothetical protein
MEGSEDGCFEEPGCLERNPGVYSAKADRARVEGRVRIDGGKDPIPLRKGSASKKGTE